MVEFDTLNLFWRGVMGRGNHRTRKDRCVKNANMLREAEIAYLRDVMRFIKKNIRWFDVTVNEVLCVNSSETTRDLDTQLQNLLHRQRALRIDELLQRATRHVIGNNEWSVVLAFDRMGSQHVGMINRHCDSPFSEKAATSRHVVSKSSV